MSKCKAHGNENCFICKHSKSADQILAEVKDKHKKLNLSNQNPIYKNKKSKPT